MSTTRRQFTRDYKMETVRLSYQRKSIVELASELGICSVSENSDYASGQAR